MKHPDRVPVLLHHLVVACNRILLYVDAKSEQSFLSDIAAQDAVVRQIEVLGEAAKRIRECDEDFFDRSGLTDLYLVIGMRNRIAHEYLQVRPDVIWQVASKDAPRLRSALLGTLQQLGEHFDPDALHF